MINHVIIVTRFRVALFSIFFPSTRKRKAGVLKFLQFEERYRKAPFSSRVSVNKKPSLEKELRFQMSPL